GSGSTTGHHVDALDQRGGQIVDAYGAAAVRGHHTRAVEQHKGAVAPHAAHVELTLADVGRHAVGNVVGTDVVEELGEVLQLFGHAALRGEHDQLFLRHRSHRHWRLEAYVALNARAGDGYFLHLCPLLGEGGGTCEWRQSAESAY